MPHFDKAIAVKPDFAEAFYSRGNAFLRLGRYELALRNFEIALAIEPKPDFQSSLIFALNFVAGASAARQQAERARCNEFMRSDLLCISGRTKMTPIHNGGSASDT